VNATMPTTGPTGAPPTAAGPVEPRSGPEAALYQRLREHLAYLRLPDAAAALPGVLDDARTRSLSPTATLERLLAVESPPPRPAGWPRAPTSPACPPATPWPTSTTPPNRAWTRR